MSLSAWTHSAGCWQADRHQGSQHCEWCWPIAPSSAHAATRFNPTLASTHRGGDMQLLRPGLPPRGLSASVGAQPRGCPCPHHPLSLLDLPHPRMEVLQPPLVPAHTARGWCEPALCAPGSSHLLGQRSQRGARVPDAGSLRSLSAYTALTLQNCFASSSSSH